MRRSTVFSASESLSGHRARACRKTSARILNRGWQVRRSSGRVVWSLELRSGLTVQGGNTSALRVWVLDGPGVFGSSLGG